MLFVFYAITISLINLYIVFNAYCIFTINFEYLYLIYLLLKLLNYVII